MLTPDRARTLVPALKVAIGDVPYELHTHCRAGLGELTVLESVPHGIDILHLGVPPLASGDALPNARYVIPRLKDAGYSIGVEDGDLAEMEEYFTGVARRHGKPIGRPNRYDPTLYSHQVPGGMISNLRSQLKDMGMEDRIDAVLEEAGRVREDLGYPILVSPFAQFVITQTVINVVQGERYATIPDEIGLLRSTGGADPSRRDGPCACQDGRCRSDYRPAGSARPALRRNAATRARPVCIR